MTRWRHFVARSIRAVLPIVIQGLNVAVYVDAPSVAGVLVVTMLLLLMLLVVLA